TTTPSLSPRAPLSLPTRRSSDLQRLGDAAVEVLAGATFARRLTGLDLDGNHLTDLGLWRLARDPVFANLEELHVADCQRASPHGFQALFDSPHLNRLIDLSLGPL